jgi:hypothetical protein
MKNENMNTVILNPVLSDERYTTEETVLRTNQRTILVGIDSLPTEIFYMLLEFYTNSPKGLLTVKQICKKWKSIGETSLLWLSCRLEFFAPMSFLESCCVMGGTLRNEYIRNPQNGVRELSIGTIDSKFRRVVRVTIGTLPQTETPSRMPLERVKACHDCFIANLSGYNKAWDSLVGWKRFSDRMETILQPLLTKLIIFSFSVGFFASFPVVYLLQDLSTSSNLSIKQQMGFFCLYLILVSYLFSHVVGSLRATALHLCEPSAYLEIQVDLERYIPNLIPSTFLICFLGSIILIHLKFTSFPEMPWTITTVPLWVMILLLTVEIYCTARYDMSRKESIVFSTFMSFFLIVSVLPATLIAFSYDRSNGSGDTDSSLQVRYMSIFYYPLAMALTALVVYYIYTAVSGFLKKGYERLATEDKLLLCFRFLVYSCSRICCLGSCLLLYDLLILVWMQTTSSFSPLASVQPVGLLLLLLACLHVSLITQIVEIMVDSNFPVSSALVRDLDA